MAADITSPFYLPEAGKFLSDNSVEYSHFEVARMDDIDFENYSIASIKIHIKQISS